MSDSGRTKNLLLTAGMSVATRPPPPTTAQSSLTGNFPDGGQVPGSRPVETGPYTARPMSMARTARTLRDLAEPIAACVYFVPEALEGYKKLGLDDYATGYFSS